MAKKKVKEMCEKVISIIPYEKRIPESIDAMTPIVLYKPNSGASQAFEALAAELAGIAYREETFLSKLKNWFRLRIIQKIR